MARPRKEIDTSTYEGRFAARLRTTREKKKMTVEEIAAVTGIPATTLYRWESGDRCPINEQILLVADALHVNVSKLIEEAKK